jgi:hypothetical protein
MRVFMVLVGEEHGSSDEGWLIVDRPVAVCATEEVAKAHIKKLVSEGWHGEGDFSIEAYDVVDK